MSGRLLVGRLCPAMSGLKRARVGRCPAAFVRLSGMASATSALMALEPFDKTEARLDLWMSDVSEVTPGPAAIRAASSCRCGSD